MVELPAGEFEQLQDMIESLTEAHGEVFFCVCCLRGGEARVFQS